jgi:sarcosine oxidase subunit delta
VVPRQWGINTMKLVNCPLNGPRNAQEFICGGEVIDEPAQDAAMADWADHVFLENNTKGVVHEWWCHVASSYWFIVTRDTQSEEILATNTADDFFASRVGES